jgi:uncharacterized protein
MIIDCHAHIGRFGGVSKELKTKTAEDLIQSMEEAGISNSIVIANNLKGAEEGIESQELIKEVRKFPDRLRAVANFDFTRLEEPDYIEQLLEILDNEFVAGLKFYTGYQQYDPCNKEIASLYEFCKTKRIPVIFHTGYLLEGTPGDKAYSHPRILGRLAEKFPDLIIIAAHFGNPWIEECGEVMKEHENVYADLSGYFTELQPISQEEKEEFKTDIQRLKQTAGGLEKCLFGTDWWLYSQKEYKEVIEALPLSETERRLVLYENARRIFRIGVVGD